MIRFQPLAGAAALLAALSAAGIAAAQPIGPGRGGIDFTAIDGDGDGLLARAELLARAAERIAAADTNGDGGLDRAEIIVVMPGAHSAFVDVFGPDPAGDRADRLLAMMGATESGRIEVNALSERRVNDLFAWIDADRDGAISQEEAEAMRAHRAEHGRWHRGMERHHGGDDEGRDD